MRRSYQARKLLRHQRKSTGLTLVSMIDIFTVLVTFLLMTAVFSHTVILQLHLPAPQSQFREPPPGLVLEVMVRKDLLQVADRNTGPLATFPNSAQGYDYGGLTQYLEHGGNYDATAAELSVHKSTLKYRLQRIRELTGVELNDPDVHFNLQLATRAWGTLQALRDGR